MIFQYRYKNIISAYRIDMIHCDKALLVRSWPVEQLRFMQHVKARRFVVKVTWLRNKSDETHAYENIFTIKEAVSVRLYACILENLYIAWY
jgi:hypothetical protein